MHKERKLKERVLGRLSSFCESIFKKINRRYSPEGMILMYHHITDENLDVIPACLCTVDHFVSTLNYYKEQGYIFLKIDELKNFKFNKRNKFIIVTFDDGCKDVIINAYPYLKQHKIPFVVYLTTDFINKPGYMTEEDIIELSKDEICTIGYHTYSHTALINVRDYEQELLNGKKQIETLIGKKIYYFAYPYGKLNMVGLYAIYRVSKSGFLNAVGTIDTPISKFSRLFNYYLPRSVV